MDLKYEAVGFNVDAILKFETGEVLAAHKSYQHLWPKVSKDLRRLRLMEAYSIAQQMKRSVQKSNRSVGNYENH